MEFGHGHSVRFRTSAAMSHRARIELSPTAAVVRDVIGGEGQFAGSVGLITSNFLISDTGDVTENHLGLIFVRDE